MRISLNLATRPFTDLGPALKRLRIAMAVLAAFSILSVLGLHLFDRQAAAARAREHSLDGRIGRVEAERQNDEAMMRQPANAQLLAQVETLNQLFDAKAFSWTLAMENMETVLPGGVQVTSIEPVRAKDGHITVHLRVAGARDQAVDLVSNLEHSRRFLLPRIVGESAESNGSSNQQQAPVSASSLFAFDLLAEYNPPTQEERAAVTNADNDSAAAPSGPSNPPRLRAVPVFPQQPGRLPYTGPSQPAQPGPKAAYDPHPMPHRFNGGAQ
jgi:type IV pilus assembly protein PilN